MGVPPTFILLSLKYMGNSCTSANRDAVYKASNFKELQFLILLRDQDFINNGVCSSLAESIDGASRHLPGHLYIESIENCQHQIREIPMPYKLYIKLPKENFFVTQESWETEYLKSQVMELIHIFTLIGATEIKFSSQRYAGNMNSVDASLDVSSVFHGVQIGGGTKQVNTTSSSLTGSILIPADQANTCPTIHDLTNNENLFYLLHNPDWISICEHRINNRVKHLNFTYKFDTILHYSTKLIAKFEKVGIEFQSDSTDLNGFSISFDVNFEGGE